VSRLLAALTHLGKVDAKPEPGPVIVTVFDRDRLADYQRMAATLRAAGIRAELYLGSGKFGPQMKYADRRRSPCVVIQGTDEKQKGEIQIKDLIVGAELAGLSKERDDLSQEAGGGAVRGAGGSADRGGARGAGAARSEVGVTPGPRDRNRLLPISTSLECQSRASPTLVSPALS